MLWIIANEFCKILKDQDVLKTSKSKIKIVKRHETKDFLLSILPFLLSEENFLVEH